MLQLEDEQVLQSVAHTPDLHYQSVGVVVCLSVKDVGQLVGGQFGSELKPLVGINESLNAFLFVIVFVRRDIAEAAGHVLPLIGSRRIRPGGVTRKAQRSRR